MKLETMVKIGIGAVALFITAYFIGAAILFIKVANTVSSEGGAGKTIGHFVRDIKSGMNDQ